MFNLKNTIKKNPLQAIGLSITIIITIANVLIGYFLLTISSNLAPLSKDIAVIQAEVKAQAEEHQTFVSKDAFDQLVERINHISNRVDSIYSILTND